ncbi:anti-sigma factor family protein [Thiohalophilus sp.]|uniref:anti-sigma factor family protein n=1 Tax=Thiohalophilus sp. TaxID=3028392 RepID=UPI002ACDDBE6|nr:zf-HC2 domain-containing protein [Thiohalophilus sp.]MDZ7661429.1 zf-HC2 domain-containing protein [Thiohalophilus sp.]
MTMTHCTTFQQQLDDWLDGQLPPTVQDALQDHLQQCERCGQQYARARELQQALHDLPVVPPSPDFARRVMQHATRPRRTATSGWLKGSIAAGALVTALFAGYLAGNLSGSGETDGTIMVTLAPQQTRTVQLAFHSQRALEDVRLTLQLPEHVEIDGYPGRRELSWQTDLAQGSNRLQLPLIVRDNDWQRGELIARLEHPSGRREFRIQTRVIEPPVNSGTPQQTL